MTLLQTTFFSFSTWSTESTAAPRTTAFPRVKITTAPLPDMTREEVAETVFRVATSAANAPAPASPRVPLYVGRANNYRRPSRTQGERRRRFEAAKADLAAATEQRAAMEALFAPVPVTAGAFPAVSEDAPLAFGADLNLKFRVIDAVLSEMKLELGSARLSTIADTNDIVDEIYSRIAYRKSLRGETAPETPANVSFVTSNKKFRATA